MKGEQIKSKNALYTKQFVDRIREYTIEQDKNGKGVSKEKIKMVLDTFQDVFVDTINNDEQIVLSGVFRVVGDTLPAMTINNPRDPNETRYLPERIKARIIISPSIQNRIKHIKDEEQKDGKSIK